MVPNRTATARFHAERVRPQGSLLVVAGDDHGCVSSSMPHQSDLACQAFGMPVLHPGNVAEYLEFGLYALALSRYSGNWVALTALSEVVESGATVDLDVIHERQDAVQPRYLQQPAHPHERGGADDIAFVHSMVSKSNVHGPALRRRASRPA